MKPENASNAALYQENGVALEKVEDEEEQSLAEWLAIHYKDFGCEL